MEIFILTEKKGIEYKDVSKGWVYIQLDGVTVMSFKETWPSDGVANYISERLEDLIIEGLCLGVAERLAAGKRLYPHEIDREQVQEELIKHARGLIKRSKGRLYIGSKTPGRKADYLLVQLDTHYKRLQPIWRLAKADSRKAQIDPALSKRWRQRIKSSFEAELPDDLIEWLNSSVEEQQERLLSFKKLTNLQKKLEAGYALTKPSDIAMEHAARLCGAPPYNYAVSTLWDIWRKQKATTKKKMLRKRLALKS